MAQTEFSWDSFPPKDQILESKDQKNGGEHKSGSRRHDDLPRYFPPTDGNRKSRPYNRAGPGRVSESKTGGNGAGNFGQNNRGQGTTSAGARKMRTASDSYSNERDGDRPKSGPPKGNNVQGGRPRNDQFRNGGQGHRQGGQDHNDIKHRSTQVNVKSDKESNTEKELRMQIMRMRGHMQYLKDQMAYKDQVIHHKDQVIIALRKKLDLVKEGGAHTHAEFVTSPVEPPKQPKDEQIEAEIKADAENHHGLISSEEASACNESEAASVEKNGEAESTESNATEVHEHSETSSTQPTNGASAEDAPKDDSNSCGAEASSNTEDKPAEQQEAPATDICSSNNQEQSQSTDQTSSEEKPSCEVHEPPAEVSQGAENA